MHFNNIDMSKQEVLHSEMSQQHSEHSDKSNPDDDDDELEEINAPRIDRNLTYEPDLAHVVINTAFTHYPVVREVALSLGMKVIDEPEESNWDLCWTDLLVTPHTFIRMHFHQSINYIPGVYTIARKNELGRHLNLMRHHFPLDYNFHPPTWMLPEDYHLLRKHFETGRSKSETFIVKPEAECQGRGIYLVNRLDQIEIGKHCVVQRYVPNPLLIEGYKFDLRVYVLIGSIDPLRIYIFNDGLGRFATETYHTPQQSNFRSNYQHLTNYAINKFNPKFKAALSGGGDGEGGFKRSLQAVMKLLKEMGADTELLWNRIKQISVKTIITSYEQLRHNYISSQPEEYHNRMAFHILGLDVLITDNLEPVLLEVNHTPSFATETPLDHRIKFALIRDTIKLMRLDSIQLKKELFSKSKTYSNNRVEQGKRQSLNEQVRKKQVAINTEAKIQFEKTHLGGYEVIFPFADEQHTHRFNLLIDRAKSILYSNIKKVEEREEKELEKKDAKEKEVEKKDAKEKEKNQKKQSSRELKQMKDIKESKDLRDQSQKNSQKDISEKGNKLKSTRDIRNHSMYSERFRPQTEIIQQNLNAILKNQFASHNHNHHILFNIQSRNNRTFTIKTKHSVADVSQKIPPEQPIKKEKEKPVLNRQMLREGNFLKPKTYDVPTLRDFDEPRAIHKRKEPKSIHF